jgi:uncharacterized protein YdgA (DUF945 family)
LPGTFNPLHQFHITHFAQLKNNMNLKLLIGAAVSIPIAYAGATVLVGKSAESSFAEITRQITEKVPYVNIAKRDYDAGMLSSTDETVLMFGGNPDTAITLRSRIQHGPLPGLRSVGSVRVTTDVIFPPKAEAELKKLFGEQRPMTIITTRSFGGSINTQIKSPAASATIEGSTVDWKGLNANIAASSNSYSVTLTSDGLVAKSPTLGNVTMKAINIDGKATEMTGADGIWLGKSKMTMGGFDMINKEDEAKSIKFGAITAATDISTKDAGFVDQIIAMTISDLEVAGEKTGSMTLNYGIKHANAVALGAINKAMTANFSVAMKGEKADNAAQSKVMMEVLQKHGMKLLKGQPTFEIEKFSIVQPAGESKLSALFKLAPISEAELQGNPLALLSKIDATGELQLAEATIKQAMAKRMMVTASNDVSPEAQARLNPGRNDQMAEMLMELQTQKFVGLGYATRKDGLITIKFVFKNGEFTLNGIPFDSSALN